MQLWRPGAEWPGYGSEGACAQAGGYGKVISHVVIGLKTVRGIKQLKLDPTIYDSLQKERVNAGDVIYIEASSGMHLAARVTIRLSYTPFPPF